MIIIDTNVISEIMRPMPNPAVVAWVKSVTAMPVSITAVTQAEVLYGLARMDNGARKNRLQEGYYRILASGIDEQILPFTSEDAQHFALIAHKRAAMGRPISHADCQIAAIAMSSGHILATRNTKDFEHCGIDLINPWDHSDGL